MVMEEVAVKVFRTLYFRNIRHRVMAICNYHVVELVALLDTSVIRLTSHHQEFSLIKVGDFKILLFRLRKITSKTNLKNIFGKNDVLCKSKFLSILVDIILGFRPDSKDWVLFVLESFKLHEMAWGI
jgi:hypothetical protein